MPALFKIINLHFWKSIFGPFFAFVFPIIFIAILGSMLGFDVLFGNTIAISAMAVSLTSMPQAIFEFKKSSLLKRIGVTPIKPWMFLLMAGGYYVVVMLVGTFFSLLAGIAIFSSNWDTGREIANISYSDGSIPPVTTILYSATLSNLLENIQWGGLLYGILMNILVGTSLGLVLVSVAKSTLAIQGVGIPILIISQFLSAQVLPLSMVRDSDAMWYLSYISPFKSTSALIIQSFSGNVVLDSSSFAEFTDATGQIGHTVHQHIDSSFNIFDTNAVYKVFDTNGSKDPMEIFSKPERILNLILPFLWMGGFGFWAYKKFSWTSK